MIGTKCGLDSELVRLATALLLSKALRSGDCLLWTGETSLSGFPIGKFVTSYGTRWLGMKRIVYRLRNPMGSLNNAVVGSSCGNKLCLETKHLVRCGRADLKSMYKDRDAT